MDRVVKSGVEELKSGHGRLRKNPCKSLGRVEMLSTGVAWLAWS